MTEEGDPQDTAILSNDMCSPKIEQEYVKAESIYSGLVALAKAGGKIYKTNGRTADLIRFDLTSHSVFVGNSFIVQNGRIKMPVIETAYIKVDMTGAKWLSSDEQKIDPNTLFTQHYLSRPTGTEKYTVSNFRAKDVDEMTDDELSQGESRCVARVCLEAWILCAAMDGTLEKYVTAQPNWNWHNWWWSKVTDDECEPALVIKTEWWRKATDKAWELIENKDGSCSCKDETGRAFIQFAHGTDDVTLRTVQNADTLLRLAKTLSQEAFKMQMRTKCYELDPIICEINRTIEYVETGKIRIV